MIQSMTAFSRVQHQSRSVLLSWELRSLNHRYLDISFRLPEAFRHLESILRQSLRGKVSRGKFDFQLKLDHVAPGGMAGVINDNLVKSLISSAKRLATVHCLADDIMLSHVMSWPGVIQEESLTVDDLTTTVETIFLDALEQLLLGKRAEGLILQDHINTRLQKLRLEVVAARNNTASMQSLARIKLMKRLDDLHMGVLEPRLEQELALMLVRLDVSEELDRLEAHINEVERTLNFDESSGKRLDFLMQELNREANTLSSKSDSVVLSQHAVEMKVLIDQMREQIQNVE